MWYEEVIKRLPENLIFTRKELYIKLQEHNREFNYNSYKWILPELISKGLIYRRGYDAYSRNLSKVSAIYTPRYSEKAKKLQQLIEEEYPLAEFCVFESFLLNEFLNHQIANNTIVIQIEKEIGGFLFDFLEEEYAGRVLYKPKEDMFQRYWSEDCVIIVDKVSEAPKDKQNPYDMTLEKLLVDIFAESIIRYLFSPSEYPLIVETAMERYLIDEKKMMRYARRRNAAEKLKNYMKSKGEEDAYERKL